MKYFTLILFLATFNSCSSLDKTEGRKIASVKEFLDLEVDGSKLKLFYKGIDVSDSPRNNTAFIIFNPHLSISKRNVMITEDETALKLCNTFTSTIPDLKKYDQKIVAINGDLKDFGLFTDNTIGLVSGIKKNMFHIQTKEVQHSFFEEIHCAIKK